MSRLFLVIALFVVSVSARANADLPATSNIVLNFYRDEYKLNACESFIYVHDCHFGSESDALHVIYEFIKNSRELCLTKNDQCKETTLAQIHQLMTVYNSREEQAALHQRMGEPYAAIARLKSNLNDIARSIADREARIHLIDYLERVAQLAARSANTLGAVQEPNLLGEQLKQMAAMIQGWTEELKTLPQAEAAQRGIIFNQMFLFNLKQLKKFVLLTDWALYAARQLALAIGQFEQVLPLSVLNMDSRQCHAAEVHRRVFHLQESLESPFAQFIGLHNVLDYGYVIPATVEAVNRLNPDGKPLKLHCPEDTIFRIGGTEVIFNKGTRTLTLQSNVVPASHVQVPSRKAVGKALGFEIRGRY